MELLKKHWPAICGLFLSALYIYLQLLVWKRHGDDLMLIAGSIVVTVALWIVLIVSITHYRKLAVSTPPASVADRAVIAERDRLQQENAKLQERVIHFQGKFNQSMELSGKYMKEVEDLYADTVLHWLKHHIKSTGRATTKDVAGSLELPEALIQRGFEWLARQYQVVSPIPGFDNAWNYTATMKSPDAQYRIVPARGERQLEPTAGDPRVYIEVDDNLTAFRTFVPGSGLGTQLHLLNRGGTDAHNVHLSSIELRGKMVTFPKAVSVIAVGQSGTVRPTVGREDDNLFLRHNLVRALIDEWNSYNDLGKTELAVPVTISYEDFTKNQFETHCELVINPFKAIRKERNPEHEGTIIEARNYSFRRVLAKSA